MSRASVDVHAFCRELRKRVMEDVRKIYTAEQIKASWVWDTGGGRKSFEFRGPNKEYIYNLDADCKWSAEASGWSKLLAQKEHAMEHFYYQDGDVCLYCRCPKGSPEALKPCLNTVKVEPDVYEGSR